MSAFADWYGIDDGYTGGSTSVNSFSGLFVLALIVGFAYSLKNFKKKTADKILLALTLGIPYYILCQTYNILFSISAFVTIGVIAALISDSISKD